jgi:hypothetical protein
MKEFSKLVIDDNFGYIFLRKKDDKDVEILSVTPTDHAKFVWIDYATSSGAKVYMLGRSMKEIHVRELTDEIVISRANGYTVTVIESPLDFETNPTGPQPKEYVLSSLGKK